MIKNILKPLKEIDKSDWFYLYEEPFEMKQALTGIVDLFYDNFIGVMHLEYLESISEEIYLNIWYKLNGN